MVLNLIYFSPNFVFSKFRRCWFQVWQRLFEIPALKHKNSDKLQALQFYKFNFFWFYMKLFILTNSRVLFLNMAIVYKIALQSTQIVHVSPKFKEFLFNSHKTLHFKKFEGVNFKYKNCFFKIRLENTQIRHFWSQKRLVYFTTRLVDL